MKSRHKSGRTLARLFRRRRLLLAVASLPLFQATGCFPDPIGALNFELQSLVNSFLINTVSIIVLNLLGL